MCRRIRMLRLGLIAFLLIVGRGPLVYAQPALVSPNVEVQTGRRPVATMAFSPDGKLLASGGAAEAIKVREIATGQILFALPC